MRGVQIACGKKLVQMRINENRRPVIVRFVGLPLAIGEFRLVGRKKTRDSREIVVRAHQQQSTNVWLVSRVEGCKKRKSASETYSDDAHRSRSQMLLQPG